MYMVRVKPVTSAIVNVVVNSFLLTTYIKRNDLTLISPPSGSSPVNGPSLPICDNAPQLRWHTIERWTHTPTGFHWAHARESGVSNRGQGSETQEARMGSLKYGPGGG